jgi:hypothetical protein
MLFIQYTRNYIIFLFKYTRRSPLAARRPPPARLPAARLPVMYRRGPSPAFLHDAPIERLNRPHIVGIDLRERADLRW